MSHVPILLIRRVNLSADSSKSAPQKQSPFEALSAHLQADMQAVNNLIIEKMDSPVALIPQLASHIIAAGGKRLRPLLTLACADLCGYQGERHQSLAACVEFIHTATLLHDDVVDESHLRRGQESANAAFGNKPSVLVGDFLFSRAFQLMVQDGSLEVLRILSAASATIAEGEVLQLAASNDTNTGEDTYREVIKGKTAQLFAAACEVSAVITDQSLEKQKALATFGMELGIAFQIVDDILDYSALQAELGKEIGDDFRDGKITLPVIHAFTAGDESEKKFWKRTLEDQDIHPEDLDHALSLIHKYNCLERSMNSARLSIETAKTALSCFGTHPMKQHLEAIADFCISRKF